MNPENIIELKIKDFEILQLQRETKRSISEYIDKLARMEVAARLAAREVKSFERAVLGPLVVPIEIAIESCRSHRLLEG